MPNFINHGYLPGGEGEWTNRISKHFPEDETTIRPAAPMILFRENIRLAPAMAYRDQFACEMHDVLLGITGESTVTVNTEEHGDLQFGLPNANSILDFMNIEPTDSPSAIKIDVSMPLVAGPEKLHGAYYSRELVYEFPKPYEVVQEF